jgi:hypothetical protein
MKKYLVKFIRQIPTEIEFEIEAVDYDEAVEQAYAEFDEVDWSYIDETDTRWNISFVKELQSESK